MEEVMKLNREQNILNFWEDVANQNEINLPSHFSQNAIIYWHNTNEKFSVEEFVRANCEYPGAWLCEVERIELMEDLAVTATRVWSTDNSVSFHAITFFEFVDDKIVSLNEYWGDDGIAPQWRLDKEIGEPIK